MKLKNKLVTIYGLGDLLFLPDEVMEVDDAVWNKFKDKKSVRAFLDEGKLQIVEAPAEANEDDNG